MVVRFIISPVRGISRFRATCDATERFGIGSATSRAGYGDNPILREVEERAAHFFESESTLYYASGYMGNAILLQGLSRQYDVIFMDEESYYSVRDGAAMANKPVVTFAHCNTEDLQKKLNSVLKPSQIPLLICDGVFPTSGQLSPLREYVDVLDHFDKSLICVDDAHATGVLGKKGQGTFEYYDIQGERRYASGTMSKAVGGYGGMIVGTESFIDSLKVGSRIPAGSSSVPVPAAAATAKALDILSKKPQIRQRLWDNVAYAKSGFRALGFDNVEDNPVPIICLSPAGVDLCCLQQRLFEKGIAVLYIPGGSYTSAPKEGAIRIAIFATHSRDQINHLITEIKTLL